MTEFEVAEGVFINEYGHVIRVFDRRNPFAWSPGPTQARYDASIDRAFEEWRRKRTPK